MLIVAASDAGAGLSSENVVVVVNGDSLDSRTVANYYIEARQIPSKNVVVLEDVPEQNKIELSVFRERILKPLLAQLDTRKIASQVRVIAYSAGFPTAVTINEHREKIENETTRKYQTPTASITGLTYFYRFIMSDNPSYLGFGSNLYARGRFERHFVNPFNGELKERFEQASKLLEEEKYSESAELWQELHDKNPEIPSVALRAAEAYSQKGNGEKAVELIRAAIKHGWWSAAYLRDTPALDRHLDDPAIAKSLPLMDDSPTAWQGPEAFSSGVGWTLTGCRIPLSKGGVPYLASCSLAVIHPLGSTLPEAVRILERAAKSDRKFPSGRFAFADGADVRAKTRSPGIADTVVYLQEHDFNTEIFRGRIPEEEGALLGLMTGSANVQLFNNRWQLVRGAIAENLTSFGGAYDIGAHTKITEFLLAGAAMSSGAVAEPYSLQFKFPMPMLYGYYARGLSAIEAFYQSVTSPYQLLIVGDPLAQPFAEAPAELVDIELLTDNKKRIHISRRSIGLKVPSSPTRSIEISINDRPFQTTIPVPNIDLNWPQDSSGIADVRVTLTGLDRTEPRVTFVEEIDVQGEHPVPTLEFLSGVAKTTDNPTTASINRGASRPAIECRLACSGADRIELRFLGEAVGSIDSDDGKLSVKADQLGGGPLRFRPVAYFGEKEVRGRTMIAN
jgi:tetratricopeptide (TPR) repeat protein